ncbi:MAG: hypothetical protein GYB66_02125 [Chloroflexi bacterium]|nr:hypothetical protein [Chloroflexota bacterium]
MLKKVILGLMVLALLPLALPAVHSQDGGGESCFLAVDTEYLEDYFVLFEGDVSQEDYLQTVMDVTRMDAESAGIPEDLDAEGFSLMEAISMTLYYVNMDELAYSYPEEKANTVLEGWEVTDWPLARRQELAAALDAGLLATDCQGVDLMADLGPEAANYLLSRVLVLSGTYEHSLGYTTDADIYNDVFYTWYSFDQVLMAELQAPANEMVKSGVITGYNVKRSTLSAAFDPELSIVYGHSSIDHAIQLIGLLRSEGISAKVALEPKTSAFLYLAEWGEPTESPSFQVEPLEDGNYIAYAKEYDLVFEFESMEDKERFDGIIKSYAKKNEGDLEGLIVDSWWQPLYSSRVPMNDYIQVTNNLAAMGDFYVQSFALMENSETVLAEFEAAYPDAEVWMEDLWVNEAFHNYLMGEAQ